ncbi:MAG: hypothetical protein ABI673_05605 [Novosphingobium sp.]
MSKKLALSSAASILMMAAFALFGEAAAPRTDTGEAVFSVPAEMAVPQLPALPRWPSLR